MTLEPQDWWSETTNRFTAQPSVKSMWVSKQSVCNECFTILLLMYSDSIKTCPEVPEYITESVKFLLNWHFRSEGLVLILRRNYVGK